MDQETSRHCLDFKLNRLQAKTKITPNQIDFKPKLTERHKEGYVILFKGTINQDDSITKDIHIQFWCTQFHKKLTKLKTKININPIIIVLIPHCLQ